MLREALCGYSKMKQIDFNFLVFSSLKSVLINIKKTRHLQTFYTFPPRNQDFCSKFLNLVPFFMPTISFLPPMRSEILFCICQNCLQVILRVRACFEGSGFILCSQQRVAQDLRSQQRDIITTVAVLFIPCCIHQYQVLI